MRLLSWNVLADAYIRAEFYPRSAPELLRPGARRAAILDAIERADADVLCLQEAEPPLLDAARARLGGWTIRFLPRPGKPDGCAMLARPGWILDDVAEIVFDDGDARRGRSGHVALLATVALGGARVRLATTHLRWDPRGTAARDRWAIRQTRELLAALGAPAIACGDLNVEADDDVLAMFASAGFVDVHASAPGPTANPNHRAKRIDFILCTRDLTAAPVPVPEIDDTTPLPSPTHPSDHVAVRAVIAVRCSPGTAGSSLSAVIGCD